MFAMKSYAGKHLICDFQDIPSFDLDLKIMCKELCELHHFEILGEVEHVFQPQGYTLLFLLSESHLSLHTFPEKSIYRLICTHAVNIPTIRFTSPFMSGYVQK